MMILDVSKIGSLDSWYELILDSLKKSAVSVSQIIIHVFFPFTTNRYDLPVQLQALNVVNICLLPSCL